jgi:hypothetical protein
MLKGGEFLRVSAMRDGMRYLIHLPVANAQSSRPNAQ